MFFSKKILRRQQNKAINRWEWYTCDTLRLEQNGGHFVDNIFKCIFLTESTSSHVSIQLHFVPEGPVHNMSPLVQEMAWHLFGAKPLPEPMLIHITDTYVTRPQCVNPLRAKFFRGNINMYLHFVSFLHIDKTQVVEILPQIRQEPTYST